MIGRAAVTSLAGAAAISGVSNLLTVPAQAAAAQGYAQAQLSFTCGFSSGPRAGQSQSYAGVAGIQAAPVGTHCADGQGSTGTVVRNAPLQPPLPVQLPPTPTVPATTFLCQFDNGPRAGQVQSYAGVTGMRAIGIGAPCTDGQGSSGAAIAAAPVQPPASMQPTAVPLAPATTSVCRFDRGPRAGQLQSYAGVTGMQPVFVGSACTDGQGSSGVAVPVAPVQATALPPPTPLAPVPALSSTCQFDAGPRAGQFQSYAGVTGIRPTRVGRQCTDGQGSTGVAIADAADPPPPAVRPRAIAVASSASPVRTAPRGSQVIANAAVGAPIPGARGAVWADPKNSGYVTGYMHNGRYHPGTPPPVYDGSSHTIAARFDDGAALGAAAGAVLPSVSIVGSAVSGLDGAVWVDINNDGVADGYVYRGRYYSGVPAGNRSTATPPPPPPPPSAAPVVPPISRSGERG